MHALHNITSFIAHSGWDRDGAWWFPFGLLWLIALAALVWFVVRSTRKRKPSAIDTLAERYARGEVSTEEYRERLDELQRRR
jgi:putative membrane protein